MNMRSIMPCIIFIISVLGNEQIILNENNTVVLDSSIDHTIVTNIMFELAKKDNGGNEPIYLYIHSPGGEVIPGNDLINFIEMFNNRNNLICVANYAASMAFAILQSCKTRYGTKFATLMQHQIHLHIKDTHQNIETYMKYANHLQKEFIQFQARRIGKSNEEFYEKIKHDWWLTGENGIKEGALDKLVLVGCDKTFIQTLYNVTEYKEKYIQILTYSRCPLLINPIQKVILPPMK